MGSSDPLLFVYGANPAVDEDDTTAEELIIVTSRAAEKISAAHNCRTWGEYAALCGKPWEEMLEDFGRELQELTGRDDPGREAPFKFARIHGLYYVGDLLDDPRTDAYEILLKLPRTVRQDARLENLIEWSGGSPGGHLSAVTARNAEAVDLLQQVLREAGYDGYRFERDDHLICQIMGF